MNLFGGLTLRLLWFTVGHMMHSGDFLCLLELVYRKNSGVKLGDNLYLPRHRFHFCYRSTWLELADTEISSSSDDVPRLTDLKLLGTEV